MPKFKLKPKNPTPARESEKLSPRGLAARVLELQRKQHRLDEPTRPVDENGQVYTPSLPPDITKMSNEDLGRLQGQFTAFGNYVRFLLATFDIEKLEADENEKMSAAEERLSSDEEKVRRRADLAIVSPRAVSTRKTNREKKAMVLLLKARMEGIEQAVKTLSREQTRRQAELEHLE